jgi:hypothetical protein
MRRIEIDLISGRSADGGSQNRKSPIQVPSSAQRTGRYQDRFSFPECGQKHGEVSILGQ